MPGEAQKVDRIMQAFAGALYRDAPGPFVDTDAAYVCAFSLMMLNTDLLLAAHAYELHIEKSDTSIHYATIIELHHPDYLNVEELRKFYTVPDSSKPGASKHIRQLVSAQHPD